LRNPFVERIKIKREKIVEILFMTLSLTRKLMRENLKFKKQKRFPLKNSRVNHPTLKPCRLLLHIVNPKSKAIKNNK
jgi:hypothetical protein